MNILAPLIGAFILSQLFPSLGRLNARLLEFTAREQRYHSDRLDRAYRAYGEEPKPDTGIEKHWRDKDMEVRELERMASK